MRSVRGVWTTIAGVAVLSLPSLGYAAIQAKAGASVSFTALGPAGLHIVGTEHDLAVTDDGTSVTLRVPLAQFKTGIELRDHHMQKYLDVEHHREAVLVAPKAAIKMPTDGSAQATLQGQLTLHGTTRPVTFSYKAKRTADGIQVDGTMRVDIRQYGIEVPSYLGVTVKPDVDVAASFTVQDR